MSDTEWVSRSTRSPAGRLLELADVLADRGLPDAEPDRRPGEAAGLGNGQEGLAAGPGRTPWLSRFVMTVSRSIGLHNIPGHCRGWLQRPVAMEALSVTVATERRPVPQAPGQVQAPVGMFAAMHVRNFRLYSAGQSVANTGTWMQSIAQDWLVLELTGSAAAVGVTMALQFLPTLLFGVQGGMLADRFPKRTLLTATQSVNGILTAALAVLAISGQATAWEVYAFALVGGLVFVVDNPARQVFVNELVPAATVRNAIALNAAVFQATRLIGPALAGLLISTVGTGWAFAANCLLLPGADRRAAPDPAGRAAARTCAEP